MYRRGQSFTTVCLYARRQIRHAVGRREVTGGTTTRPELPRKVNTSRGGVYEK